MQKFPVVASALFLILLIVGNIYGNFDARPWSEIAYSNNKKYVFVLISSGNLENYSTRTRKSWEPLKLSPKELQDYEANLAGSITEEKQIRSLYSGSGLYLKENPQDPLWKISTQENENWLTKFENVLIADDGSYVIGFNYHVSLLQNETPDKPDKEEVGLFIYTPKKRLRSYKVTELVKGSDSFAKSSEGFVWAKKELILDNEHKTFTLIKMNEDRLEFNISDGEILPNLAEEKHSTCLGFILLFVIAVWTLK